MPKATPPNSTWLDKTSNTNYIPQVHVFCNANIYSYTSSVLRIWGERRLLKNKNV